MPSKKSIFRIHFVIMMSYKAISFLVHKENTWLIGNMAPWTTDVLILPVSLAKTRSWIQSQETNFMKPIIYRYQIQKSACLKLWLTSYGVIGAICSMKSEKSSSTNKSQQRKWNTIIISPCILFHHLSIPYNRNQFMLISVYF